jgi:type IV pilus assembly protein PilF
MRHEWIRRWAASFLLAGIAGLAGCSTTGGDGKRSDEELSRTGDANVRLAQTYLSAGKLELAADRAERAIRSDPSSAQAHVVMGMVLGRLDEDARAGEHFLRAAKLAPGDGFVNNAAGVWLCEHGRAAEADPYFARGVDDLVFQQRAQLFHNAGKCAASNGDLAGAERYLRGGLNIAADDRHLLEQMVRVKLAQGDALSARAFLQRREALAPLGPEMLGLAVQIEERAGDTVAAQRYRQQLANAHPGATPPANGSQP